MPDLKNTLAPALIEVLMATYYRESAALPISHLQSLEDRRLIFFKEAKWECTDLGKAHVKQLCGLPLPARQEVLMNYKGEML